jgi:hypothetical protein
MRLFARRHTDTAPLMKISTTSHDKATAVWCRLELHARARQLIASNRPLANDFTCLPLERKIPNEISGAVNRGMRVPCVVLVVKRATTQSTIDPLQRSSFRCIMLQQRN